MCVDEESDKKVNNVGQVDESFFNEAAASLKKGSEEGIKEGKKVKEDNKGTKGEEEFVFPRTDNSGGNPNMVVRWIKDKVLSAPPSEGVLTEEEIEVKEKDPNFVATKGGGYVYKGEICEDWQSKVMEFRKSAMAVDFRKPAVLEMVANEAVDALVALQDQYNPACNSQEALELADAKQILEEKKKVVQEALAKEGAELLRLHLNEQIRASEEKTVKSRAERRRERREREALERKERRAKRRLQKILEKEMFSSLNGSETQFVEVDSSSSEEEMSISSAEGDKEADAKGDKATDTEMGGVSFGTASTAVPTSVSGSRGGSGATPVSAMRSSTSSTAASSSAGAMPAFDPNDMKDPVPGLEASGEDGHIIGVGVDAVKGKEGNACVVAAIRRVLAASNEWKVGLEILPFKTADIKRLPSLKTEEDVHDSWYPNSRYIYSNNLFGLSKIPDEDRDDDDKGKKSPDKKKGGKGNKFNYYVFIRVSFPPGADVLHECQHLSVSIQGVRLSLKRLQIPDTSTPMAMYGVNTDLNNEGVQSELIYAMQELEQREARKGRGSCPIDMLAGDDPFPEIRIYSKGIKDESLPEQVKIEKGLSDNFEVDPRLKTMFVVEVGTEDYPRVGPLLVELEKSGILRKILGKKARIMFTKKQGIAAVEADVIHRKECMDAQIAYNVCTTTRLLGQIETLNKRGQVETRPGFQVPQQYASVVPPPRSFSTLRQELMDICTPDGKPAILAAIPVRGNTDYENTVQLVVPFGDKEKNDLVKKMIPNFAMWLNGWMRDVRGYTEGTRRRILKGCDENSFVMRERMTFDVANLTVKNEFSSSIDDTNYFDDMRRDCPAENYLTAKQDAVQISMGEEARQELLGSLNVKGGQVDGIKSVVEGAENKSKATGMEDVSVASTQNTQGTQQKRDKFKDAIEVEKAKEKERQAQEDLKEEKEKRESAEARLRVALRAQQQAEELLRQQSGSPHLSGSSPPGKSSPPQHTEAGGSGGEQA